MCNYSNKPYELKADSFLAKAEPVEHVPETGGEQLDSNLASSDNVDVSVLPDVSTSPNLQPTLEQDPTTVFHTSTISAAQAADTAGTDSSLATESPHSHIQYLIDGLPNNLTVEQCAHAEALIKSRAIVFSHSEYNIGRTKVIPHCIDTGDSLPHFEQLWCHPTTQLLLVNKNAQARRHRAGCITMVCKRGNGPQAGQHHEVLH